MKRVRFFFMSVPLALVFFCALPSDLFEDVTPEYNDIEAVTSASYNIQVTGGRAYNTYAILETYHKDGYRFHFIGYGTGIIDSVYPETLIVVDTPRVHICTLTNLFPNTKYDFIFRGEWPANPEIESHTVEGVFTTVP